jgi:hypothetical protein
MLLPMALLAACCAVIGILPVVAAPALDAAIAVWLPADATASPLRGLAPLGAITACGCVLAAAGAAAFVWLHRQRRAASAAVTWDCGYAVSTPRMQYTASSFAQQFVALTRWLLPPHERRPACAGLFPAPQRLHTEVTDIVLDRGLIPALRGLANACNWLRLLQRGRLHVSLLYILLALLFLLLFS